MGVMIMRCDYPYYTLLIKFDRRGPWRPEFGDDSKPLVKGEAEAYREDGHRTRVIATEYSDGQAAVDAAVARLNGGRV